MLRLGRKRNPRKYHLERLSAQVPCKIQLRLSDSIVAYGRRRVIATMIGCCCSTCPWIDTRLLGRQNRSSAGFIKVPARIRGMLFQIDPRSWLTR